MSEPTVRAYRDESPVNIYRDSYLMLKWEHADYELLLPNLSRCPTKSIDVWLARDVPTTVQQMPARLEGLDIFEKM